ncbi:MAG: NifB/NifX family molybdenum-iron cluster-binding protein [Syntrophales bacterium]
MKICITSEGPSLDSKVDPRFGRCRYFIIVDTDTLEFKALENRQTEVSGGAGIQSGQFISSNGARAVMTGNVGPNAFQTLQAAGIDIFTGISGTVRDALRRYREETLTKTQAPTAGSKAGLQKT